MAVPADLLHSMTKYSVKIVPGAKVEKVLEEPEGCLKVWVKDKPIEGRANLALIETLAKYFDVPKSSITITHGLKGRDKVVEIED